MSKALQLFLQGLTNQETKELFRWIDQQETAVDAINAIRQVCAESHPQLEGVGTVAV